MPCSNSLFDNTLVLGTPEGGGQRSSLTLSTPDNFFVIVVFIEADHITRNIAVTQILHGIHACKVWTSTI